MSIAKPNIVLILADNLGWGELGCYGGGELRGAKTPESTISQVRVLSLTTLTLRAIVFLHGRL